MAGDVIGHVSVSEGSATLISTDGTRVPIAVGTEIHQHDQIVTDAGSNLEITFIDGTQFAAAPGSEFEINKAVYNPEGTDNGLIIGFMKGGFEFVAGKIAPLFGDGMRVDTPAGSLGVRGTAGAAVQDPNTGQWTFMLLKDPNGHLGKIALINAQGQVLLDEWMESSVMGRDNEAPTRTQIMSTAQVRDVFGSVSTMIQSLGDQTTHPDAPQVPQPGNPPASSDPTGSDAQDGHLGLTPIEGAQAALGLTDIQQAIDAALEAAGTLDETTGEVLDPNDIFEDLAGGLIEMPIYTPVLDENGEWTGQREINGSEASETFSGTNENDIMNGLGGIDVIRGEAGHDVINGGNDDDQLIGGAGNDTLNGGAGTDLASYQDAASGIDANLASGIVSQDGDGGTDQLDSIEQIVASNYNDHIDARGAGINVIEGLDGDDTVEIDSDDYANLGNGNDQVQAALPTTGGIHGGGGIDTWNLVDAPGATIDLGALYGEVTGIDRLNLDATNGATLTLSAFDLFDATDNGELFVDGGADDVVTSTSSGWTQNGTTTLNGVTYSIFQNMGATLYVDQDIQVNLS